MACASAALLVSLALAAGSGATGSGVAPPPRTAPRAEWDAWNASRAKLGLLPRKRPPPKPRRRTWQFRPPAPAEPSVEAVALAAAVEPPVLVAQLDPAQDAGLRPTPVVEAAAVVDAPASDHPVASDPVAPRQERATDAIPPVQPVQTSGDSPGEQPAVQAAGPVQPSVPTASAVPASEPAPSAPAAAAVPSDAPPAAPAGTVAAMASRPDATMWEHDEADGRTVRIVREPSGALVAAVRAPDGRLLVEIVLLER